MNITSCVKRLAVLSAVIVLSAAATHAKANVYLPGNGTNTVVQQGLGNLPTGSGDRSFITWVDDISGIPANGETVAGYGSINPSTYYHRSAFVILPTGQLGMDFQVGYVLTSNSVISYGAWTQIVGTYSSTGGVSLYVNGVAVPTLAGVNGFSPGSVDTINVNNNAATFGYEYGVTNGSTDISKTSLEFQGNIAADSIWNRILTPSEVATNFTNLGVLSNTNGLVAQAFGPVPGASNDVPEPTSAALLIVGVLGLLIQRTRNPIVEPRSAVSAPDPRREPPMLG